MRSSALDEQVSVLKSELVLRERQVEELQEKNGLLERQVEELITRLAKTSRDARQLETRLKELLRRRAGGGIEAEGQLLLLFGEDEPQETPPHVKEAPDGETPCDSIKRRHRSKRPAREKSWEGLPHEHVFHELGEEERVCPETGLPLVVVGEKTTEEVEYRPAKLVVIVHHRAVYGLSEADREERRAKERLAPMPPRPIEKGDAGPGLLAWLLVQKYRHHLPLHRQEAIFAREGLFLPRQTLCDWVMACAELLGPIQQALRREIVASGVVQTDDTGVLCMEPGGGGKRNAHLWAYLSPLAEGVVYDFTLDREHGHVLRFVEGLRGYLVGDGFSGFKTVANKRSAITDAGCWAHAFRKFRDALDEEPELASRMMSRIGRLFDVEREAQEAGLDAQARRDLRAERSAAELDKIREEVEQELGSGKLSDQSEAKKALFYVANQWPSLTRFLEDGRVPIHNNACEQALRPVAVGRRNWLFAGSERGGHAAATVYSVIESCRQAGVDPFEYLRDVLVRVSVHPASRIEELLPHRWKKRFAVASAT